MVESPIKQSLLVKGYCAIGIVFRLRGWMSWIVPWGMKWEDGISVKAKSGDSSSVTPSAKVLPEIRECDGIHANEMLHGAQ